MLQAQQIMHKGGVDSLLMVDGENHLLGVIWLVELLEEKNGSLLVDPYLSDDFTAVNENTTLKEIITAINYNSSSIIPVVSSDHVLKGYLTKSSLLATMSRQFISAADSEEEGA